ncbi:MAG: hypothetical protein DRR16_32855 [Candidatus Parabeggiatoa sp. nov. 3]|nr:MAG: hypothetical protein DRR00_27770 [Gammaproteobacteria bacterium]RKZ63391.1 MAG: hypothetical protein DRQ99_17190 [Gammaproteobacteria bacterium]RKZ73692.1 MAG: hypothetical protein DRR16_32855 [Gammaproteobacteria bacterium]
MLFTYFKNNLFKELTVLSLWIAAVFWLFDAHQLILILIGLLWLGLIPLQNRRNPYWQNALKHAIAASIPIVLMFVLYHSVLQAWWLADDPGLLQRIAESGIFPHFYQSDVWRAFSASHLTPWVPLSLGIDWHLFGLEPLGFYAHHLLSFTLVLLIAYLVLNLFYSPLVCSLILSLFVASVPCANVAQLIMVRHYLEGLGLSLLAIFAYVKALQSRQHRWAYFGALFYLLATTAKEIYVPLVIILPCLPVGNWKQRWKMLIPFVAVAGSYVVWRAYMLQLSYVLSGYSVLVPQLDWAAVLALPNRIAEVLGWQQTWQGLIILLAVLVYLSIVLTKQRHRLIYILIWLAACLLPIIPVLSILDSRYLFLPYLILCLGVAVSLQFLMDKRWHYIALGLGFSLLAVGIKSVEIGPTVFRQVDLIKQFRTEGQFILKGNAPNALLQNPIGAYWYYESLQWFREQSLKLPQGARACYDVCVCQPQATAQFYQYANIGQLISSTLSEQACGQADADLTVHFKWENGALHWELGPYAEGQYYIAPADRASVSGYLLAIPAKGQHPQALSRPFYFVIKYVSIEGWQTYSPVLKLLPEQEIVIVRWERLTR